MNSAATAAMVMPENLPEHFEWAVGLTRPEFEQHVRLMAALKMFELGKISSGKAAELADMGRVDFLQTCGRYRVSVFNYSPEEVAAELQRELESFPTQNST
jgi:predicted HTH domain antitoxin